MKILTYILKRILKVVSTVLGIFIPFQEVSVLCYHAVDDSGWQLAVTKGQFEKHLVALRRYGYKIVPLADIVAYTKGELELPQRSVAITFDDGYQSVYENAFPIMKKLEIPFTVFTMGDFSASTEARGSDLSGLSVEQMAQMKEETKDLFTEGYHGAKHKLASQMKREELEDELKNSKGLKYFAYPGGHHTPEAATALSILGYEAAFTISPGLVKGEMDPFYLPRTVIQAKDSIREVAFRVSIAGEWYAKIRHKFFNRG